MVGDSSLVTTTLNYGYSVTTLFEKLLQKVCTPLRDDPLDSMLNVIHGIGYSSNDTVWFIDIRVGWDLKVFWPQGATYFKT